MSDAIDDFLAHGVWRDTALERLIPLAASARIVRHGPDEILFKQFHPADQLSLLVAGSVAHETSEDIQTDAWAMGHVDWPWAALGWSGFLPPNRNGTTARTLSEVELVRWQHEDLARIFYTDPLLAIDFLRLVLDSMRLQFEWLRTDRLGRQTPRVALYPAVTRPTDTGRHRFAPGLLTALRRSAFFEIFPDDVLVRLAENARLVRYDANREVIRQGEKLEGLWILASGKAASCFAAEYRDGERLERFRSITAAGGIVAGLPTIDGGYTSEASVLTESVCCFYELPTAALHRLMRADPEFGRSFMQRQLARLAHLMTTARLPRPSADEEIEVAAVKSILAQNQARIPVSSALYKLPHLLGHRLTTADAFACLGTVAESGRYEERAIARSCRDLLCGWYREHRFYRDVLEAYCEVVDGPPDVDAERRRQQCDERLGEAFRHLHSEIHNIGNLPARPGNIVIMNHLACPPYYRLPNNYHFSFDTAFVSVLLSARYGRAPIRVIRQSPGAEYGHNLFYSRLGHITVPTVESGLDCEAEDNEELDRLRRLAADTLFARGRDALGAGYDVLICPEGQSQKAADSPARFFSGAFRLALKAEVEPQIVPIAIAGFDRRYKGSRLVAIVEPPFRLSAAMRAAGTDDLRAFVDKYHVSFRDAVHAARQFSHTPGAAAIAAGRHVTTAIP
jgi:CRP-like cAMP-binding protein